MNRKVGSTELIVSENYTKNISLDGFRTDPKSNTVKHENVS